MMMEDSALHFLFAGDYVPDYNRTDIIRTGLEKLGHRVTDFPFKKKSAATRRQLVEMAGEADLVFMPSFTHKEVAFVRRSLPDKKIIFDPLVSRYLTRVFDYRLVSRFSFSALRNFYRDKRSLAAADFVVTDTEEHRRDFHARFKTPLERMGVLHIGNNFDAFYPEPRRTADHVFRVGFYGGFIPLQGVTVILDTARRFSGQEDVEFELIGTGFEYAGARAFVREHGLRNVSMPGWISVPALRERINQFDVALGIFGDTVKSNLVIPNKVYHYVACARPVITKDTPAIREVFVDREEIILIPPTADALSLAIQSLKRDPATAGSMATRAHAMLKERYSEVQVARRLVLYARGVLAA